VVQDTTSPRQVRFEGALSPAAPPLLLSLAINRAAALIPSPPGSVHARQRFTFLRPVTVGADLRVWVRRAGEELRRGRTHVVLEYRITDTAGTLVATAESRTVWAQPAESR
jgi:acyl dehydratase